MANNELKANQIQKLLEYFLKSKGAWEDYLGNIDENFRNVNNFDPERYEQYINCSFLWDNAPCKPDFGYWDKLDDTWLKCYDKHKFIKDTKIARKLNKNAIIDEFDGYILVSGEL